MSAERRSDWPRFDLLLVHPSRKKLYSSSYVLYIAHRCVQPVVYSQSGLHVVLSPQLFLVGCRSVAGVSVIMTVFFHTESLLLAHRPGSTLENLAGFLTLFSFS